MTEALYFKTDDLGAAQTLLSRVRQRKTALVEPLSVEDAMLRSMEDASPAKWYLAHTARCFEELILRPTVEDYISPDDRLVLLFNSYYLQAGPRHTRKSAV